MQISLRIEINVKNALLGLLLLPFIIPSTLMQLIPQLNSMIFYLRLVSTAMIFLCYIERRERGIVVFEALNFLFAAFLILVSAYNGRSWGGWLQYCSSLVFITMWFSVVIRGGRLSLIRFVSRYYVVLVVINFVLMLLYPNGLIKSAYTWGNHLLGSDNHMLPVILSPMVLTIYLSTSYRKSYVRNFLIFLLFAFPLYYVWSGTAVAVLTAILLLYIISQNERINKKFSIGLSVTVIIIMFLYICVFQNLQSSFIITDILGKDLTFTGRIFVWTQAVEMILKKPLLGYGKLESDVIFSIGNNVNLWYAHNQYLMYLIWGGVTLLLLFFLILLHIGKRNKRASCMMNPALKAGLVGYLLYFLFEGSSNFMFEFWFLLNILYYQKDVDMQITQNY